jgi:hypothetical protein
MRLSLTAQMKHKLKALMIVAVAQWAGGFLSCAYAAGDDITIRVIGLDEVPSSSLRVIELPDPDLGEIADINESIISETPNAPIGTPGDSVSNGGGVANPVPPPVTSPQ